MELNHESSDVKAQALVWNTAVSHIYSMSLKCAIELGIFDIIHDHGSPMTLPDLVSALAIPQRRAVSIACFMRLLTHAGFFESSFVDGRGGEGSPQEQEAYVLTAASRLLLKGNGNQSNISLRPMVELLFHPNMVQSFKHLSKWFHYDSHMSAFQMKHGKTLYDYSAHDPGFNVVVNECMASDSLLLMGGIIDKCRRSFEQSTSLVDVGGGNGLLAKGIANVFPKLEVTVLDLPHVVRGLDGTKNLKLMEGDMFEHVPHANMIMLKWILHNWNDEECLKILKRCKEAITAGNGNKGPGGGKLIVIDMVMGENKDDVRWSESELLFDVLMMVVLTGKERSRKDWAKLFADAGFGNFEIIPLVGSKCIIEVYP